MWDLNTVSIGDYIEVQIVNKRGDRNLNGVVIKGNIKDIVPRHNMVRLESDWCCHTKDILCRHISANQSLRVIRQSVCPSGILCLTAERRRE